MCLSLILSILLFMGYDAKLVPVVLDEKIMFKSYTSNDNLLLPPCLGDFIPQNDPVRVVHRIIEQINLEKLYRRYFSPRLFCIPPSHDASDSGLCLSA